MTAVMAPDEGDDLKMQRACRVLESGRISKPADIDDLLCLNAPGVLPVLANALQHRTSIVRSRAAAAMRRFDEAGFSVLLTALLTGSRGQRLAAAEALGNWGDGRAAPYLIEALEKAQQEFQSDIVKNIVLGYFFFPIMVCVWVVTALRNQAQGSVTSESYRLTLIEALGKLKDLRAIPALARMVSRMNPHSRMSVWAQDSLQKLLPGVFQLTPDDADRLGASGVPALIMLLTHSNSLLVENVLEALRAIGDGRAIPIVHRIANGWNTYLAEKARSVLPVLLERAQVEAARLTLLRGSSTPLPRQASSELLRAAQPSFPSQQPEQLLRATNAPDQQHER